MLRQNDTALPLDGTPTVCAYNPTKTRIAITDGSRLLIRSTGEGEWDVTPTSSPAATDRDLSTSVIDTAAHGAITSMCWNGVGQGHVVVCGTEKGVVMMYSEGRNERVGISNSEYGMVAEEKRYSTSAVVCVERVDTHGGDPGSKPNSDGQSASSSAPSSTLVAVGYKDGVVRLFECTGMDDSALIRLHSVIQCPTDTIATRTACIASSSSASSSPSTTGNMATLVLLVGYVSGDGPTSQSLLRAYRYNALQFCWEDVVLGINVQSLGPPGSQIGAMTWAPLMGRTDELIAIAVGPIVKLFSLRGNLSDVQVEDVGTLEHTSAVWQVKMNMTGTWLAASTENNEVCLWRPDLTGEWVLLNTIRGNASS